MREILFRGKRVDNGEWIKGDLITTPFIRNETQQNIIYILDITKAVYDRFEDLAEDNGIFEVDPETVCQYTGLTDKNGRKIFEGDILSGKRYVDYGQDYGQSGKFEPNECIIKWNKDHAGFDPLYWWDRYTYEIKNYEIIGNIFDNPELFAGSSI